MRALPLLSLCALFLASPCLAATIVVNGSVGQDCYLATLTDPSPDNDRKAVAACNTAVANSTGDDYNLMAAYVNRADIRLRMQDYSAAVADAEQALAMDSRQPVALLNRGAGLVGLRRYDEAISTLNQVISLNAESLPAAYFNRALAEEATGDVPGAYHDYKQALALNPKFQLAAQELTRFSVVDR